MKKDITDALANIRSEFIEQLLEGVTKYRELLQQTDAECWNNTSYQSLKKMIHSLIVSAGTFGLPRVAEAARSLELMLSSIDDPQQLKFELKESLRVSLIKIDQVLKSELDSNASILMPYPVKTQTGSLPLIHLIEGDPEQARYLIDLLEQAQYCVRHYSNLETFEKSVETDESSEAVIIDLVFSEGEIPVSEVIESVRRKSGQTPPVLYLSTNDDLQSRLEAYRSGANRYLVKPVEDEKLLHRLELMTDRIPAQPYRVLLVDDDLLVLKSQAEVLRQAGMEVHTEMNPLKALDAIYEFIPEVLILDVHMSEATGPELAILIREDETLTFLPILFLSAETDLNKQQMTLSLGAVHFQKKPIEASCFVTSVLALAKRYRETNKIEASLRRTLCEQQCEHLALNHHAIVSITDITGKIVYVNDHFCRFSGYSRAELLEQNHRIIRPDGDVRYIHELAKSEFDENGKLIRLASTAQDVTTLKQAEHDLLIFRRIFDSSEQGIGVSDAEGHILYSNRAHDRILGYSNKDFIGKHFSIFFSDQTSSWAVDEIMETFSEGKSWSGLMPFLRADGTEVMTSSSIGFVANDDGSPLYIFNIFSDYTEEQRHQDQLAEAKEAAEQANQAKSEFLSSMSHELRTPMNAILGFAQILEIDDKLNEDQRDSVHEILKGGRHLLELINEVLDLAKVESGRIDLSLEPVDLSDLVDECFALVSPVAVKHCIDICHGDMNGHVVRADRTRLKQVMLNLLSNAIKYNRENGTVELKVNPVNEGMLRITIADTGNGIPEEKLKGLFQPFNRLDAEYSEIEGTGIGLTITLRIVEMMDGFVGVESEVGVGSSFWIELPREYLSELNHGDAIIDRVVPKKCDQKILKTILYIEDNPSNLNLVEQVLSQREQIQLITAHTPELGIELALSHFPDLILLDINLPGMDGYQVMEVFNTEERLKDIPVLAITANAMPRDIKRGKAAGFSDYLIKPLDIVKFLDMIDLYLYL